MGEKRIYDNPWIGVTEYDVLNPSGGKGIYGKVFFKNLAIGAVPLDGDGYTWLLGQYRFPLDRYSWEIPEGGGDVREAPVESAKRELLEETGLAGEIGELIGVHDQHLTGTAPNGRHEDFHAVNLVFAVTVPDGAQPRVTETDGTADAAAWVPLADIEAGAVQVTEVVRFALGSR